jgi:hypothetical protein
MNYTTLSTVTIGGKRITLMKKDDEEHYVLKILKNHKPVLIEFDNADSAKGAYLREVAE